MKYRCFHIVFFLLYAGPAYAQDTLARKWYVPDYAGMQFAGGIGMFAGGVGYDLYKDKWQMMLLYGYVPSRGSAHDIHTLALKQTATLLTFKKQALVKNRLYSGFTLNYETGNSSHTGLPPYYSSHYYPPVNALHATVFLGFRSAVPLYLRCAKTGYIEPYAEVGGTDVNLWYLLSEREVKPSGVFRLALGVNILFGR